MRPASRRSLGRRADTAPVGFQNFELGRRVVYLRRDLAVRAPAIVASLSTLGSAEGAGNRLSGFALKLADGMELFTRINRRGGLIHLALKDLYVGIGARPVRELSLISTSEWAVMGNSNVNTAPRFGAFDAAIRPPNDSMMFLAMDNPIAAAIRIPSHWYGSERACGDCVTAIVNAAIATRESRP